MAGEGLMLLGGLIMLIGLIALFAAPYLVAQHIAPSFGLDSGKAAVLALVASLLNMLLWFLLTSAITGAA